MTIENRIETIAELLSGVGVTHAFGICGSGPSLTLIGALDKIILHKSNSDYNERKSNFELKEVLSMGKKFVRKFLSL